MNKRILILEGRKTIGGGQVVTRQICDCLKDSYDVYVFLPGSGSSPIAEYLQDFRHRYYKCFSYTFGKKRAIDYLKFIANFLICSFSLVHTLIVIKPSVIYIQHMRLLPIAVLVDLCFRIPVIAHIHVVHYDKNVRRIVNKCLRSKNVIKIVGVSYYSLHQLEDYNRKKSLVIYNPVAEREIVSHNSLSGNIAIIGDVFPLKGHHILLKAISQLPNNLSVYVIGNIVDQEYKKYLDVSFPHVKCIYTGMIGNVDMYLAEKNVDITVIASSSLESFSLAMVESWAQGIPTIASDDFGMKELVENFLPQYAKWMLFRTEDSNDLMKKIEMIEKDKTLYDQLSTTVKIVSHKYFNVSVFKRDILNLISEVLE